MIHPIDEVKKRVAIAKEDPYRDAWVGYTFLAIAVWALSRGKKVEAPNPVTPLPKDKADPAELVKGTKVELEHTDDDKEAEKIALQHLAEDAHYYSKLEKVFPEHHNPIQPYHGEHTAPDKSSGSPLYDVTLNGIYPKDFYSVDGFRYYCDFGEKNDRAHYSAVLSYKDRPNARVEVYRAVPKELSRKQKIINPGDWVTLSRKYAVEHGIASLNDSYSILTKTVRARDLFTSGDSIYEWGYDPQPKIVESNPIPPANVAAEAREGLELRSSVAQSRRGGTSVGLARAKQLSSRQNISEKTMKRMKSFFARHEVDKKAQGFRRGEVGYPSKGLQAWKLWGGDSGKKWVKKFV
jgi:hypothetical protein